jgi:DnaJ-class molecular chaperone
MRQAANELLSDAYKTLSDAAKRAAYDAKLKFAAADDDYDLHEEGPNGGLNGGGQPAPWHGFSFAEIITAIHKEGGGAGGGGGGAAAAAAAAPNRGADADKGRLVD